MKLHTDGPLRVERIDGGCLAIVPEANPLNITALASHAPEDDPYAAADFEKLVARSNACLGLDLPDNLPHEILADLLTVARDALPLIEDAQEDAERRAADYKGTRLELSSATAAKSLRLQAEFARDTLAKLGVVPPRETGNTEPVSPS